MTRSTIATGFGLGLAVAATVMASEARAQSNVTVSGWVHGAVTHMNNGTSQLGGGAGPKDMWSVGGDDSALQFQGTEDLGGGMKARFFLDHRLNADNGTVKAAPTVTKPFWWTSWVALDTPLGSLQLGRQPSAWGIVSFLADPSGWMGVSQIPLFAVPNLYPTNDILRVNNAVTYTTPKFGPWQAAIQAAPNEGPIPGRETGLRVEYAAGPAYAGLAFEKREPPGLPTDRLAVFTGSYDFGVVKPILSFARTTVGGQSSSNGYSIGAVIRLPGTSTLHAAWAVSHFPVAGFVVDGGAKTTKLGLQYRYNLSKRTFLFTSLGSASQEHATRTTGYDFGLRHNF